MNDPIAHDGDASEAARLVLNGRGARARAYALKTIADHGIFRLAYRNWHEVAPGLYRSNQPYPYQLAMAARAGVRTVVNLRGRNEASYYLLEREACAALGLTLVDFPVMSRELPERERLHQCGGLFEAITYPALMHCKSGADRAGLMSAIYLLIHEGRPVEDAARQLSLRYGHYRRARTGVLDAFLDTYRAAHAASGIGFLEWVDEGYDRAAIERSFHENRWASILVDRLLARE